MHQQDMMLQRLISGHDQDLANAADMLAALREAEFDMEEIATAWERGMKESEKTRDFRAGMLYQFAMIGFAAAVCVMARRENEE